MYHPRRYSEWTEKWQPWQRGAKLLESQVVACRNVTGQKQKKVGMRVQLPTIAVESSILNYCLLMMFISWFWTRQCSTFEHQKSVFTIPKLKAWLDLTLDMDLENSITSCWPICFKTPCQEIATFIFCDICILFTMTMHQTLLMPIGINWGK